MKQADKLIREQEDAKIEQAEHMKELKAISAVNKDEK
jgi:hypothetical protein